MSAPSQTKSQGAPPRFSHLLGLVWTLVRTDFKTRYHGTMAGFLWAILKPVMMFLVLMGVFSLVFAGDPHYRLNLVIGLFLWDFFSEATKVGVVSLFAKGYLINLSRFPTWILVVSSLSNALITMLVFGCAVLVVITMRYGAPSPLAVALLLLYVVQLVIMAMGISLATSVLFLRYRDLNQIWDVVIQACFFVTPIVYPLDIIPHRYHALLYLWPVTPIVMFSRSVLVQRVVPTLTAHLLLLGLTLSVFGLGYLIHRRFAPRAAELL